MAKEILRIWIGWDSRFPIVSDVLAYSLRKYGNYNFDIKFIKKYDIIRAGFKIKNDPKATTEFTYTRFLVPYIATGMGDGWSLFMDNDMLCYENITNIIQELIETAEKKILFVRKHDYQPANTTKMYGCEQTSYPRKNWSSMMLMNNFEMFKRWQLKVVQQCDGARLHQFKDIPDELIGDLPEGLNDLTHKTDKTKILHFTEGGPWFEQYKDCPHAEDWLNTLKEMQEC